MRESGAKLLAWPVDDSDVVSLAIDPVRPRIATLGGAGGIAIWDQATGAQQLGLTPAYGYGWSISFSDDGTLLATGGDDGAAHVWDAGTGELLADIPADPRSVLSVDLRGERGGPAADLERLRRAGPLRPVRFVHRRPGARR